MRKLIFVFIFIILLTGCTASGVSASNGNSDSLVIENPDSYMNIINECVNEITIEDILNKEKLKSLESLDVFVSLKSCTAVSFTEAEAVIEFTKGEYSLSVDTVLDIYYFGTSADPEDLHLGGINITVEDEQLIITYPFGIEIYSIDTLEYIDTIKVFSDGFKIIDTVKYHTDYISAYTDGKSANLLTFNKDGQVQRRYELEEEISSIVLKTDWEYNQYYAVAPQPQIMLLNNNDVLFTSSNIISKETSFIYNNMYKTQYKSHLQTCINDPKGEFYILDIDDGYASVFVMKDGKLIQQMRVNDDYLMDGEWGKSGVTPKQWDENSEKITLVCNTEGIELIFDFKNKKIWTDDTSKAVIENNLEDKISDSPDGKYSIWWTDGGSGGDVMVMDMYLVENRTGKAKYLDTIGGMYGGNAGCGFFSNGDIYTIMLDEFKVFTTDMSQKGPVFEMSKNFPLGDNAVGQGTYRDLLSARRDPVTHSWTVLYNEYESKEMYRDYFVDYDKFSDNFYKSTYKVGILDPQGNLTKVYDTGEYVMSYSFRQIKMHMEAGDILYFSVLFKGYDPQLEGKIDLKTGEYTNISGGYNSL